MKNLTVLLKTIPLALLLFILLSLPTAAQADVTNKVNYTRDVIYQIVTDRFSDGDPSNNPTGAIYSQDCSDLHKYCGGDWQGIIDKINDGYLTDLGITAIWISQPVENVYALHPSGYTSYHGYWARDYKRTNPFYGDFSDFDRLMDTAHSNGIKVIMDFTPNHSSPALETDPNYAENGAVYNDGVLIGNYSNDPNNLFHHNGGTDFSSYEDSIYRNLYDLADYDLNNTVMDQYLKESIKLWLDKGIDGIRVDAVKHMSEGWQTSLMSDIYAHEPVFTFGEWFLGSGEVDPQNHHFANESGMSLLDFQFGQTIRDVLMDGSSNWYDFNEMIASTEEDYDEVIDQVTFIDNHDMSRFSFEQSSNRHTDIALAVLLTSRGVPTIYYGTEQYLTGGNDPENRKPMSDFDRTTNSYQIISTLASLRQSNPALGYGNTSERWINSDVYIYERAFGDSVVLTAVNSGDTSYTINNLNTSLPQGQYTDELQQLLDGNEITVNSNGAVDSFQLSANGVSVWQITEEHASPLIGHVGPMMGKHGNTVTITGEGFGDNEGSVLFDSDFSDVLSWSDTKIEVSVPDVTAGHYDISVVNAGDSQSPTYDKFEVLTGDQVSIRFAVNNATTSLGTNLYIVGNVNELGNWDPDQAIGPMFNQVMYQYPTWYYDISVPAEENLEYKFIKKDSSGNVVWESGNNHTYTTPATGTDTVLVDWQ
ncbi:alpha-amylase family glycosyl hydrolase [Alkalihalobacillus trypoxylicola]|uniref:Cyclomaltodextrin glucanotransferase n=1 Tax=Alkalihalobacillus trypoxylicola TaxID=519424 RepID=A0A162DGX6_9BACI|nr:alpha-amylase family glycosyl hydrolase [Alkalihalobacillus trypoxylicola]KYG29597.1 alpha-amylase [Alkalihalobacillus trypoxylicola]